MGFFDRLFGGRAKTAEETRFPGEKMVVKAPMDGIVLPLEQLPDETFAAAILGPGCGIEPTGGTVYAPFDGKVTSIVSTLHAVGLESTEGIELLIHIGMDTIALRGSGFTPLVREGQAVKAGTPLLNVDLDAIRAAGLSTESAVIVTNADDLPKLHIIAGGIVSTGTPLFKFEQDTKKTSAAGGCLFRYAHAFSGLYCRTRSETRPLKNWMKGPRQNAQMRVPRPTRPPKSQQSRAQKASVKTRQPKYWKCV